MLQTGKGSVHLIVDSVYYFAVFCRSGGAATELHALMSQHEEFRSLPREQ